MYAKFALELFCVLTGPFVRIQLFPPVRLEVAKIAVIVISVTIVVEGLLGFVSTALLGCVTFV